MKAEQSMAEVGLPSEAVRLGPTLPAAEMCYKGIRQYSEA